MEVGRSALLTFGLLFGLGGCGGGQNNDDQDQSKTDSISFSELLAGSVEAEAYGQVIDSAVSGIRYKSGGHYGITDETGKYGYLVGEPVEFFIGDISLGKLDEPLPIVTPYELAKSDSQVALNIARFLQTLDNDSNGENGIQINEAVHFLAEGAALDFSSQAWQEPLLPELEVIDGQLVEVRSNIDLMVFELTAATDAGARYLVSSTNAYGHIATTLDQAIDSLESEAQSLVDSSTCEIDEHCKLIQLSTKYTNYCPLPGTTLVYSEVNTDVPALQLLENERIYFIDVKRKLERSAGLNDTSTGLCMNQSMPPIAVCGELNRCEIKY